MKQRQLRCGGISHYLVCRARGKNELAVRVKWQTVDLCCVGIYCMAGFGGVVWTSVPTEVKKDRYYSTNRAKLHNFSSEPFPLFVTFDLFSSFLHHELLVVGYRSKEGLVKQVPGDVFHHSSVTGEDSLRIHYLPLLWHSTYVPQTDCLQIRKDER